MRYDCQWDSHSKCINYKNLQVAGLGQPVDELRASVMDTNPYPYSSCQKTPKIKCDDIQLLQISRQDVYNVKQIKIKHKSLTSTGLQVFCRVKHIPEFSTSP